MVTFLHAADIHLDSRRAGLTAADDARDAISDGGASVCDALQGATRRAFQRLVSEALRLQVDFVVLAGDLYDGDWDDIRTGLFLTHQLRRLHESDIDVFVVSGNHDAANVMTRSLQTPPNVHWFPPDAPTTYRLESLRVALHGQSFQDRAEQRDLAADYPHPIDGWLNIGVLHTSAHLGGREHDPYAPCSLETLIGKGYDYWALGHIHKRQILHPADPVIAYSGNLQGRHVRETGAKGCWLVQVDAPEAPRLEFLPTDVARWEHCRVDVAGCGEPEAVLERARTALQKAVAESDGLPLAARVEFLGASAAHDAWLANPQRWTAEVLNLAAMVGSHVWIERVRWSGRPEAAESGADVDELGEFLAGADQREHVVNAVIEALRPLRDKLPAPLLSELDTGDWRDSSAIAQLVRDAAAVLRGRMRGDWGSSKEAAR